MLEGDASLLEGLRDMRAAIAAHPRVTRAIVSAFVQEGRRFARTAEGRRLREQLMASPRVARLRLVWDAFGLDRFVDGRATLELGRWLDVAVAASHSASLERLLSQLLVDEAGAR